MNESNGNKTAGKVVELRSLQRGQKVFSSDGYTHVKVTKAGEVQVLKLAIRSTGLTEIMDKMRKAQPTPPFTAKHVKHDDPVGRQLKIPVGERQWVYMHDLTDEDYRQRNEEFNRNMTLETINQALVIDFIDEAGAPVEDRETKMLMLEEQGISPAQFNQIMADINTLTELTDSDRERFFEKVSV